MTIGKVIRLADALKPNAIDNELKYQYITEVEGLVQTEVMLLSSEDIITYDPERDGENTKLLVKPPHDKLYIAYLAAMIDFANGEYDRYANTIEQFNAYYREYHRWYFSRFHPADGKAISEGYYLSAYAIAVKHGYEGSEEEFAAAQLGKTPELRYNADVLEWKYTDEGDDAWRELIDVGGIEDAKTAAVNAALTAGEQAGIAQEYSAAAKEYAEQAKESSTLGMTAAKVGDYAKVAEVDENGVPTRFEAAEGSGGSFVVTLTKTDSVYSGDKTFAEIGTALENGLTIIVRYGYFVYNLVIKSADVAYFALASTFVQGTAVFMISCTKDDIWSAAETFVEQTANRVTEVTSASTDTEYPSAKAAYTLAANSKTMIVKVTQGSTITADKTFSEISNAINSGRLVAVLYNNYVMTPISYYNSSTQEISFAALSPATGYTLLKKLKCTSANEWTYSEYSLEHRNNLVTSIGAGSGNTQYPSAKAVYDAIEAAKPDIVTPTEESTDTQAASAKAVWNMIGAGGSGGSGKAALDTFMDNTDIDYLYDESTGAYYTVIRVYKQKLDGSYQYPFVYAPNGAGAGDKSTYDMTVVDGWLLAINSGIFNTSTIKPDGIVIQNGTVVQNASSATYSQCKPLTIDSNGDLSYAAYDVDAAELVDAGIVSAVCGFMPIVVDYAAVDSSEWNSVSHYTQNAQRQIIGQWGNGDYAIITCEGRGYHNSDGWTIAEAQAVCIRHGLKFAYNLDGGGSTETMLGHKPVNTIYENATGRVVPTFIVFSGATVPPAVDETGGSGGGETEVTLTGISATYTGGDVAVGTAVTELIGIVVTANYSDGSTATVTEYTLSGEIAEGENTVTVTYAGLTTTFTVVGVAESGFEPVTANATFLVHYGNVVSNTGISGNTSYSWHLTNINSRIAAVTTEPNINGQQTETVNDINYYPIPIPSGATKVIITCPGFIPGDRYYSYDANDRVYTDLFDPGWQVEGGVTRELDAEYEYMTVNFKDVVNSGYIPDGTDTSGFSIVFE